MNQEELNKIIENHQHWLNMDCEGWENMRICLVNEDLSGLNFSYSNLSGSNFLECVFSRSEFSKCDFSKCNFSGSYFSESEFSKCDFSRSNFSKCDFSGSYFSGSNFSESEFSGCVLFEGCFIGAKNVLFIPTACPEKGSFIGFKKAMRLGEMSAIVELLIPEDAKRSSGTSRKCRCDKAKVLSITSLDGKEQYETAKSNYNRYFLYEVGKEVSVSDFCEDRFRECAAGIHFFINREEAVRY